MPPKRIEDHSEVVFSIFLSGRRVRYARPSRPNGRTLSRGQNRFYRGCKHTVIVFPQYNQVNQGHERTSKLPRTVR